MAHGEASGKLPVLARDKKKPEIESIPHRELSGDEGATRAGLHLKHP